MSRLLVLGGAGGIGSAVVERAEAYQLQPFVGDQSLTGPGKLDIGNGAQVVELIRKFGPFHHVVVASGINLETKVRALNLHTDAKRQMEVNYLGPMVALQAWLRQPNVELGHFVVVSSNSAHIPRSQSLGYCASKAALSMAIRCAARAEAKGLATIWGVEPGWVEGTPMSERVKTRVKDGQRHRIPGNRTQGPEVVADFIVEGIVNNMRSFNGCMFRLDGGEL